MPPTIERDEAVPVFDETMGGALIDAARINVMAALQACPDFGRQIVIPGQAETPTVHDCLAQAMEWLDAARALSLEQLGGPPTSIHVVGASR